MLEGVIQKDDFWIVWTSEQLPNTVHAVFIHRNLNLWKLPEILQRLISQVFVGACAFSLLETFCLSAIASAQSGHAVVVFQQVDKVFRMWRFSRTAKVEVAHANHRLLESCGSQDVPIV